MRTVLSVTGGIWLALELTLLVRDRVRGTGGTGRDRGTRALNFALIVLAVIVADALTALIGKHSPLRIPGAGRDPDIDRARRQGLRRRFVPGRARRQVEARRDVFATGNRDEVEELVIDFGGVAGLGFGGDAFAERVEGDGHALGVDGLGGAQRVGDGEAGDEARAEAHTQARLLRETAQPAVAGKSNEGGAEDGHEWTRPEAAGRLTDFLVSHRGADIPRGCASWLRRATECGSGVFSWAEARVWIRAFPPIRHPLRRTTNGWGTRDRPKSNRRSPFGSNRSRDFRSGQAFDSSAGWQTRSG